MYRYDISINEKGEVLNLVVWADNAREALDDTKEFYPNAIVSLL